MLDDDGDPRSSVTSWLAERFDTLVVMFTFDERRHLVARAVAHPRADDLTELQRTARRHLVNGQQPDLPLPAVGGWLDVSAEQVADSFLAEWHSSPTAGRLVRLDHLNVAWIGWTEAFEQFDGDVSLADVVALLRAVLGGWARRRDAELKAEEASSDLAQVQEALAASRQLLDEVALARGNELRDTTRRLQGWLRLASANDLSPDVQQEMLHKVSGTADRLAAQVGDLLDGLSRESALREEVQLVDLNGVAAWVRSTLEARIDERRARIVTMNLPSIHGAPSDFRRILLELVGNALEHGGRFVEIVIDGVETDDGALELRVSDNGPGVPLESREKVFEPGYQTGGGAGFGLTRLRLLLEERGGSIRISESRSGGCAVRVVFPGVFDGMRDGHGA